MTSGRQPSLLLLDNALDHGFYRPLDHWSRAAGFRPAVVWVAGGEELPEADRYSHVIVSGSEDSILARPGWAEEEARWLAEAVGSGCAVLGSCWGHQLLAVALAGPQAVRRAAEPEFGWLAWTVHDPGGLLPEGELWSFSSHFDEVVSGCHPKLRPLGESPGCALQAVRWGERPVWGIQAHPEVDADSGRGFLQGACELWPAQAERFGRGLAGPVRDSRVAAELVRRFLSAGPRAG